jgi:hypothetical protein
MSLEEILTKNAHDEYNCDVRETKWMGVYRSGGLSRKNGDVNYRMATTAESQRRGSSYNGVSLGTRHYGAQDLPQWTPGPQDTQHPLPSTPLSLLNLFHIKLSFLFRLETALWEFDSTRGRSALDLGITSGN